MTIKYASQASVFLRWHGTVLPITWKLMALTGLLSCFVTYVYDQHQKAVKRGSVSFTYYLFHDSEKFFGIATTFVTFILGFFIVIVFARWWKLRDLCGVVVSRAQDTAMFMVETLQGPLREQVPLPNLSLTRNLAITVPSSILNLTLATTNPYLQDRKASSLKQDRALVQAAQEDIREIARYTALVEATPNPLPLLEATPNPTHKPTHGLELSLQTSDIATTLPSTCSRQATLRPPCRNPNKSHTSRNEKLSDVPILRPDSPNTTTTLILGNPSLRPDTPLSTTTDPSSYWPNTNVTPTLTLATGRPSSS